MRVVIAALAVAALAVASTFGGGAWLWAVAAGLTAIAIVSLGRQAPATFRRAPPPQAGNPEAVVVNAISEPVLLVVDGRVQVANAAARLLLGEHIVGENVRLAIRHPAAAERLANTGPDGTTELVGLGGRDQRVAMQIATVAPGRRIIHLIDRTTSYAAERARVDFVANSSHELRTPLAAIIGFIETLADENAGSDPEVRERFLAVAMKEARRMQRLIDDLISLSRIEAEKYSLPTTPVVLSELIEEVADEIRDEVGEARAHLRVAVEDVPAVAGDRAQLSQVIHNLVGNAFRYGGVGQPVTISLTPESASLIRLTVADQGEGIEAEHIGRLTERFYRVDPGRSRTLGGTGLGLAIVKHIVERHRGRLDIESQLGIGTTVSVLLPTVPLATVTQTSPN